MTQQVSNARGNDLFPPGCLNVRGLLMRDTGEDLNELIDWYENIHSRSATYMWPCMSRYARNYITEVQEGPPPPYRVITEFDWKSEEAMQKAQALMGSPLTAGIARIEYEVNPPAWLTHIFAVLLPVERVRIRAPRPLPDASAPLARRAVLLRRAGAASQADFELAVGRMAAAIAFDAPDAGVALELCRAAPGTDGTPDAFVFVENAPGGALPRPDPGAAEIVNVFAVETRKSPLEAASFG